MTIREIAEKMGVSPATVSVVLNNKPGVRKELREKIAAVLLENGYTLKRTDSSNGTILLAFYQSTRYLSMRKDDILTYTLDAVQQVCDAENYHFLFRNVNNETLPQIFQAQNAEKIDGVILLGTEYYHEPAPYFYDTHIPLVILDRYIPEYPVNTVNIDNAQSMHDLIGHLVAHGHRDIGYFKCRVNYGCTRDRANCAFAAASDYGVSIKPENVIEVDVDEPNTREQVIAYLARTEKLPTAFLADTDYIAIAAILTMAQHDIRVPEDISVVGFDNSQVCSFFQPGLTTVDVNFTEMARFATQQLIRLIRQPGTPPMKSTFSTRLIVRDSVSDAPQMRD